MQTMTRKPLQWHVTQHDPRNALANAYHAAQNVCDTLDAYDTSFRADAIHQMTLLLDTWSRRDSLAGIDVEVAHEIFGDAGPALSEARRMFDEAMR